MLFYLTDIPSKGIKKCRSRKKLFDNECHKTQNGIMSLVVVKDKEIIRSMSMSSKDLFKEREEYGKRKHMHVLNFGET